MSGDTWLLEYDGVAQKGQSIMESIHERNREAKGSSTYLKLSSKIRTSLKQYGSDLNHLREGLMQSASRRRITDREAERRQSMLDQLVTKQKQMEQGFKNESDNFGQRLDLLGNPLDESPWTGNATHMADDYTDNDPLLDVHGYRQQQQHIIREQDHGLDTLSSVINRQKQMAIDIGNEVDFQNEIIEDIHDNVDRTDTRITRETKHIRIVDRKSNTCWFWVVAILLFVAILIVLFVPYGGKF